MDNIVKKFNSLSEEFLNKMIATFPEENKLKVYLFNFKTSKQFYPKAPMEYFMSPIIDLGYPIMTKDSKFFQKNEYVEFAESFTSKTGLINIWESTTESVRNSIWEYIQSLYVLGMNGLGHQKKLHDVFDKINNSNQK